MLLGLRKSLLEVSFFFADLAVDGGILLSPDHCGPRVVGIMQWTGDHSPWLLRLCRPSLFSCVLRSTCFYDLQSMIAPFLDWMTTAEFFPSPIHIHIRYLWLLRVGQRGVSFWCDRCWIPGVFSVLSWRHLVVHCHSLRICLTRYLRFRLGFFPRVFLLFVAYVFDLVMFEAPEVIAPSHPYGAKHWFAFCRRLFACILGISPGLFQCLLSVIGAESDRQVVPTQQGNTNMCQKRVLLWITLFGGMG